MRPRAQRLLAYLLLHRNGAFFRRNLAFTLWPDTSEEESLGILRRALSDLRASLPGGEDYLKITREKIGWNSNASFWLDIEEFDKQIQRNEHGSLLNAVNLYSGELLREMDEDWIQPERERYRQMQFNALRQLTAHHQARQDYAAAMDFTRRALFLEPFSESVYQDRMRLHFLAGDRAAALAEYERLQSMLENELGVEPMEDTRALADAIMRGESVSLKSSQPSAVSIPPRLVGREAETNKLLGLWDEAKQTHGSLAIISGEAGIGKSHLIRTVAHQVAQLGGLPLIGYCYEFENTLPYQPIVDALRSVSASLQGLNLSNVHRAALARLLPDIFDSNEAAKFQLTPEELRVQLFEALLQAFILLSKTQPILLLLEDMHWASEIVLDWFTFIAPRISDNRFLILATYRTDEVAAQHALPRLVRRFEREGVVTSITLERLSREANREWVAHLSGLDAGDADEVADRLFTETGGNPFFLGEIVQGMLETGQIQLENGKWAGSFVRRGGDADVPLPDSLRATILARTGRLSEMALSFLQAAATAGRTFHYDIVSQAGGWNQETSLNALEELRARGFIRESDVRYMFVFAHHLLCEAIYADLTSPRRAFWHLNLAKSIQARQPEDSAALAHHFVAAGEKEMGIEYSRKAAQRAEALYAYEEASRYLRIALDLMAGKDDRGIRIALLESLGDNDRLALQSLEAISAYQSALELIQAGGDTDKIAQTRLYRKIFQTVVSLWENARAETSSAANKVSMTLRPKVDELIRSLQNSPPHLETINLLRALTMDAIIFHFHEDNNQAFQFASAAVDMAKNLRSPVIMSTALTTLATVYGARGMMRERLEVALQAMQLGRGSGFDDPQEFIQVLIGAGSALVAVGEYSRAISYFKEAEEIARQIRAIHDQIRALSLLHLCLFRLDRWDEMLKVEEARRVLQGIYPSWRLGAPCFAIGLSSAVHAMRGDQESSKKLKDESLSIMLSVVGSLENFRRSHHY